MLHLDQYSLGVNFAVFLAGAAAVWFSGTKLSGYVDVFADRTGIGKAFAGALLLGGATSLPELGTTLTASISGAAELAGTNLLGGVVMQIAVLAVIDMFVLRGHPLTLFSPRSSLIMVGVMLIGMIAVASAGVVSGELVSFAAIGAWPLVLMVCYLVSLWLIYRYEGNPRWEPRGEVAEPPQTAKDLKDAQRKKFEQVGTASLAGLFVFASFGVLLGGFFVAKSSEVIAEQTGLGQNVVGATLVALSTSLPELSTTYSAAKFGAYSMAAANILGTNSLEMALFLPAELGYRDGLIFEALQPSASFLAMLGILATCLYLWGILERRDRTVFGMGVDSFTVLCLYLGGMALYATL